MIYSIRRLVLIGFFLFFAGCGRLKPVNLIEPATEVRKPRAVVFFVDGLSRSVLRDMLLEGKLPNIDRYLIHRGTRVENAVTTIPSITYAVTTSFLTGQAPGRHGILGNHYFDRHQLVFADFNTIPTYRDPDLLYREPTVFEILDDRYSVTIQQAIRRGVSRNIDNWASSGIRWYFNQLEEIDCLTAERFYLISKESRQARHWPELIWAYFPATDEIGHRFGPESDRYWQCLINVDDQIGRICQALSVSGLLEQTHLVLISDHGMTLCGQENYINLSQLLSDHFGLKAASCGPDYREGYHKRLQYFNRFEAVLINGGYRRANLHLRNGADWARPAELEQVKPIAEFFSHQPAVCLTAYRAGPGVVVQNGLGRALIERQGERADLPLDRREYRYRVIDGKDPLGYATNSRASGLADGEYHNGRDWLTGTCKSEYPDLTVQIVEHFESHRAGDLVIFAADGWDFSKSNLGGHGSVIAKDMIVPMVFAGPGIPAGGTIDTARTVDVAVTLIDILDSDKLKHYRFDGRSLWAELQNAESRRTVSGETN